ncbi:MAG: superoxide dismutase family protein [Desulfuromonadales bacterium]|jgi:Cu-Zn family superoxide dismutase
MFRAARFYLCLLAAALFSMACQERETQLEQPQVEKPAAPQANGPTAAAEGEKAGETRAVAQLQPTQGHDVRGTVTFTQKAEGVAIEASVQGLSPGKHGIHVHEVGDCSAPDASSAGEHYNPQGSPHGAPDNPPAQRHVGDLGNIEVGPEGDAATYKRTDQVIQLQGKESIIGKAVVIHAGPDDLTSQPAGDSGPRVACGVIESE